MVRSAMIYSISSLVGSSTTSGGAHVGAFLSGSVWSNRSHLFLRHLTDFTPHLFEKSRSTVVKSHLVCWPKLK